uniref:Uncharacterized protein n=2 Tax=Clytia hemisphaerica TaxID=252671 RepID=A0A7M5XE85_9CNID
MTLTDLRKKMERYDEFVSKVNTLGSLVSLLQDQEAKVHQVASVEHLMKELNEVGQDVERSDLIQKHRLSILLEIEDIESRCEKLLARFEESKLVQDESLMNILEGITVFVENVQQYLIEGDDLSNETVTSLKDILNNLRLYKSKSGELLQTVFEHSTTDNVEFIVQINEIKNNVSSLQDLLSAKEVSVLEQISAKNSIHGRCEDLDSAVNLLGDEQRKLDRSFEEWRRKNTLGDIIQHLEPLRDQSDSISKELPILKKEAESLKRDDSFDHEIQGRIEKLECKQEVLISSLHRIGETSKKLLKYINKMEWPLFQQLVDESSETSVNHNYLKGRLEIVYMKLLKRKTKLDNLISTQSSLTDLEKEVFSNLPQVMETKDKLDRFKQEFSSLLERFEMNLTMNKDSSSLLFNDTIEDSSFSLGDVLEEESLNQSDGPDSVFSSENLNNSFGLRWFKQQPPTSTPLVPNDTEIDEWLIKAHQGLHDCQNIMEENDSDLTKQLRQDLRDELRALVDTVPYIEFERSSNILQDLKTSVQVLDNSIRIQRPLTSSVAGRTVQKKEAGRERVESLEILLGDLYVEPLQISLPQEGVGHLSNRQSHQNNITMENSQSTRNLVFHEDICNEFTMSDVETSSGFVFENLDNPKESENELEHNEAITEKVESMLLDNSKKQQDESVKAKVEITSKSIKSPESNESDIDSYQFVNEEIDSEQISGPSRVELVSESTEDEAEKVSEPTKVDQISEPTEVEQVSEPTVVEHVSEPTEVEQVSEPTIKEQVSEPSEVEQVSESTKVEQASEPTKVEQVSEPTEVKQVSAPTEVEHVSKPSEVEQISKSTEVEKLSKPTEVEKVSEPTVVEHVSEPTEVEQVSEPTIKEQVSEPSEVEQVSESTKVEQASEPTKVEQVSEPSEVEQVSEPTEVEHVSEPTVVEHVSEPTEVEQVSEPTIKEQVSKPSEVEQISKSTEVEKLSKPTEVEKVSEPTEVKHVSEPTEVEHVSEPTIKEQVSEPSEVEQVSEPTKVEQDSESTKVEQVSEPSEVEQVSEPTEVEHVSEPTKVEQVFEPTKVEQVFEPTKVEQVWKPTEVKQVSEPTEVEHVSKPTEVEQVCEPTIKEQVSEPSEVEQVSESTKVEQASEPTKVEQVSEPTEVKQVSAPTEVEHVSEPTKINQVSKPSEVEQVSKPTEVSKSTEVGKLSKPTEVEKVSEPTEVEHVSEPSKVKEVSEPSKVKKVSEPTKVEQASESTKVEQASEPTKVEQVSEPSEVEQVSEPTKVEQVSEPTKVDQVSEPTKVEQVSEPTEVKQVSKPTKLEHEPTEVEEFFEPTKVDQVSEPTKVEQVTEPTKVEQVSEPTKVEQVSEPTKVEQVSEPTKVEQVSEPTEVEQVFEPTKVEQVSEPTKVEQASEPTKVDQASEPTKVEQVSEPTKVEQVSEPTKVDQASEPTKVEQVSEPTKVDQVSEPTKVEQVSEPTEVEQVSEPTEVEQASEPTKVDQASEPTKVEQVSEPTKVEQASEPTKVDQASEPTKVEQVSEPTKVEQVSEPTKVEQVFEPTKVEQASEPTKVEQVSEPTKVDQVSEPTKVEQVSEPTKVEQVSEPTKVEQVSEPTEAEQVFEPTKVEQVSEPTKVEQVSEPSEVEQVSEPTKVEHASKPTEVEKVSEPSKDEKVFKPSKVEQVSEPTEVEQVSEPTEVEQVFEPTKVKHVSEPTKVEQVSEPAKVEQISEPTKVEQVSEPTEVEQVSEPTIEEHVSEPSQVEQVSKPSKVEQVSEPTKVEHVSVPTKVEQVFEPTEVEHVSEPTKVEQVSEPLQVEQVSEPTEDEHVSKPTEVEKVSEPSKDEKVFKPSKVEQVFEQTEVDQVSEPTEVEQVSEPTKVEQVSKPTKVEQVSARTEVEQVSEPAKVEQVSEPTKVEQVSELTEVKQVSEPTKVENVSKPTDIKQVSESTEVEQVSEATIEQFSEPTEEEQVSKTTEVEQLSDPTKVDQVSERMEVSYSTEPTTSEQVFGPTTAIIDTDSFSIEDILSLKECIVTIDENISNLPEVKGKIIHLQDLKNKVSGMVSKEADDLLEVVEEKIEIMREIESDFMGLEESITLFDQQSKSFMRAQQSLDKPFVQQAKIQKDLVSTLEHIDSQQSMLMQYLSEEGQEQVYQRLDSVQEIYLNITEKFTDYVTEMASKCFSEMVIHHIVLQELIKQLLEYKDGNLVDLNIQLLLQVARQYLIRCEDEILHQAFYIQQNHFFECNVFDQKVVHFQQIVEKVKRELIGVMKVHLTGVELLVDFVEAFHDELLSLEDSYYIPLEEVQDRQETLENLHVWSLIHKSSKSIEDSTPLLNECQSILEELLVRSLAQQEDIDGDPEEYMLLNSVKMNSNLYDRLRMESLMLSPISERSETLSNDGLISPPPLSISSVYDSGQKNTRRRLFEADDHDKEKKEPPSSESIPLESCTDEENVRSLSGQSPTEKVSFNANIQKEEPRESLDLNKEYDAGSISPTVHSDEKHDSLAKETWLSSKFDNAVDEPKLVSLNDEFGHDMFDDYMMSPENVSFEQIPNIEELLLKVKSSDSKMDAVSNLNNQFDACAKETSGSDDELSTGKDGDQDTSASWLSTQFDKDQLHTESPRATNDHGLLDEMLLSPINVEYEQIPNVEELLLKVKPTKSSKNASKEMILPSKLENEFDACLPEPSVTEKKELKQEPGIDMVGSDNSDKFDVCLQEKYEVYPTDNTTSSEDTDELCQPNDTEISQDTSDLLYDSFQPTEPRTNFSEFQSEVKIDSEDVCDERVLPNDNADVIQRSVNVDSTKSVSEPLKSDHGRVMKFEINEPSTTSEDVPAIQDQVKETNFQEKEDEHELKIGAQDLFNVVPQPVENLLTKNDPKLKVVKPEEQGEPTTDETALHSAVETIFIELAPLNTDTVIASNLNDESYVSNDVLISPVDLVAPSLIVPVKETLVELLPTLTDPTFEVRQPKEPLLDMDIGVMTAATKQSNSLVNSKTDVVVKHTAEALSLARLPKELKPSTQTSDDLLFATNDKDSDVAIRDTVKNPSLIDSCSKENTEGQNVLVGADRSEIDQNTLKIESIPQSGQSTDVRTLELSLPFDQDCNVPQNIDKSSSEAEVKDEEEMLQSREHLPPVFNQGVADQIDPHSSSVNSLVSESSGVYSADTDGLRLPLTYKMIPHHQQHQQQPLEETDDVTLVNMENEPNHSPNVDRRQFVEDWAAFHTVISTEDIKDPEKTNQQGDQISQYSIIHLPMFTLSTTTALATPHLITTNSASPTHHTTDNLRTPLPTPVQNLNNFSYSYDDSLDQISPSKATLLNDQPSLLSELMAADDEIAKDSHTTDHNLEDSGQHPKTTLPRSSTPLFPQKGDSKLPKIYNNKVNPTAQASTEGSSSVHSDIETCLVKPPDSSTSYSDYVCVKPSLPSLTINITPDLGSPLVGKNDSVFDSLSQKSSPTDSHLNDEDMGLTEFNNQIRECLNRLLEITELSKKTNEPKNSNEIKEKMELLSHLGSQQTQIDSLNRLGKQMQESGNRETAQRVQNRLDVMNENWKLLQQRALSEAQNLKFQENIFVQESETQQLKDIENQIRYPFPHVEQHRQDSPELSDDHYRYQMIYSELFDWLLSCEESLIRQSPAFINADIIKCRLFGLQDLATEVCLHESQLKRLEDSWLELTEVNESLTNQHQAILSLWRYVTEKLVHRGKEWYLISKKKIHQNTVKDLNLTDDLVYMWTHEVSGTIQKAKDLLKFVDPDCECSRAAVSAYSILLTYNFKVLNLLYSLTEHIPQRHINDLTNKMTDLQEMLKSKLDDYKSPETSDSESMDNDIAGDSPQRPQNLTTSRRKRLPLDFEGPKFFEKELNKFQKFLSNIKLEIKDTVSCSEIGAQEEMHLYQNVSQELKSRELPLSYFFISLHIANKDSHLSKIYHDTLRESRTLYERMSDQLEQLTEIRFLYSLLHSRNMHLTGWIKKTMKNYIQPAMTDPNESLNKIMLKLMRLKDLEKKMADKSKYKDQFIADAKKLISITHNKGVNELMKIMESLWKELEEQLKDIRTLLEENVCIWKDVVSKSEHLENWLRSVKNTLDCAEEEIFDVSLLVDHVESLVKLNSELNSKEEDVSRIMELKDRISSSHKSPQPSTGGELESTVLNLPHLLEDVRLQIVSRIDHLTLVKEQMENGHLTDMLTSINDMVSEAFAMLDNHSVEVFATSLDVQRELAELQHMRSRLNAAEPALAKLQQAGLHNPELNLEISQIAKSRHKATKQLHESVNNLQRLHLDLEEIEVAMETCQHGIEAVIQKLNVTKASDIKDIDRTLKDSYQMLPNLDHSLCEVSTKLSQLKSADISKSSSLEVYAKHNSMKKNFEETKEKLDKVSEQTRQFDIVDEINVELETLDQFVMSSKQSMTSSHPISDLEDVKNVEQKYANILNEIESYFAKLVSTKQKVERCSDNDLLQPLHTQWLEQIFELDKNLNKCQKTAIKKINQLKELSIALERYQQDSVELGNWLQKKEEELTFIKEQYNQNAQLESMHFVDKCQKLKQDLVVFVTFSDSMNSLLRTKRKEFTKEARTSSSTNTDSMEQNQLTIRFNLLRNGLEKFLHQITEHGEKRDGQRLVNICQQWLKDVQEAKEFDSIQEQIDWLRRSIGKCDTIRDTLHKKLQTVMSGGETLQQLYQTLEQVDSTAQELQTKLTNLTEIKGRFDEFLKDVDSALLRMKTFKEVLVNDNHPHNIQDEQNTIENVLSAIKDQADHLSTFQQETLQEVIKTQLLKLVDVWSQIMTNINEEQEKRCQQDKELNDFKQLARHLIGWIEETKVKLEQIGDSIQKSSVEKLKDSFHQVNAVKTSLVKKKQLYDLFLAIGETMKKNYPSHTEEIHKLIIDIEVSWMEIEVNALKRMDDLKSTLHRWTDYTENMRDIMTWLRSCEEKIKKPFHQLDFKGLQEKLQEFQVIGNQLESYRSKRENAKMHFTCLVRVTAHEEQAILQNQLTALSNLWSNVQQELHDRLKQLIGSIEHLERFQQKFEILSYWLNGMETSSGNLGHLGTSPEKQKERIKKIYDTDMKTYDSIRNELKDHAVSILSHGPSCVYAQTVQQRLDQVNHRWKEICERLGMTYKDADETLFLLSVLREMLRQLNKWLNSVQEQLKRVELNSCSFDQMKQYVTNLEVLLLDYRNRECEYQSVTSLCERLQNSPEACPCVEDLNKSLDCSESFKTRWTEVRNKCTITKSLLEKRMAILETWQNDVRTLSQWIEERKSLLEANTSYVLSQCLDEDFTRAGKVHARIIASCQHLTQNNTNPTSTKIKHVSQDIQQRFLDVLKTYKNTRNVIEENTTFHRSFTRLEEEFESWLTEVEVKMIALQPYTSDENLDEQVQQLKQVNKEIKDHESALKELLETRNQLPDERLTRQGIVEELNQRYQQVLKDSVSWLFDLTVPRNE